MQSVPRRSNQISDVRIQLGHKPDYKPIASRCFHHMGRSHQWRQGADSAACRYWCQPCRSRDYHARGALTPEEARAVRVSFLTKYWNSCVQFAAVLCTLFSGFLIAPPYGGGENTWFKFGKFVVAVCIGLWFVPERTWGQPQGCQALRPPGQRAQRPRCCQSSSPR